MTGIVIIDQSNREMMSIIGQKAGIRILTEPEDGDWWISWEADPDIQRCILKARDLCMHQGKAKLTVCVFNEHHSVVFTGHSNPKMAWRSVCLITPDFAGNSEYMNVSSFPTEAEALEDVEEWLDDADNYDEDGLKFGRVFRAWRDE